MSCTSFALAGAGFQEKIQTCCYRAYTPSYKLASTSYRLSAAHRQQQGYVSRLAILTLALIGELMAQMLAELTIIRQVFSM